MLLGSVAHAENTLLNIRLGTHAESYRVVLETSNPITPTIYNLSEPVRLAMDIDSDAIDPQLMNRLASVRNDLVSNVRIARRENQQLRIVFDLSTHSSLQIRGQAALPPAGDGSSHRFYVDIVPTGALIPQAPAAAQTEPAAERTISKTVYTIALDPGHGGRDSGATHGKLLEKQIVLQFALALKRALIEHPNFRPVLTRDRDVAVPLKERHLIAENAGADLFLSLHADDFSHNSKLVHKVRGMTVYTITSSSLASVVANPDAEENRIITQTIARSSGNINSIVQDALIDYAKDLKYSESFRLGGSLTKEAQSCGFFLTKRARREGSLAVLKSIKLPSVLIEIGYISHTEDRKNLLSRRFREEFAHCVVRGLEAYLEI